ncbi:unnamed protein product [Arctogadus glacialis]
MKGRRGGGVEESWSCGQLTHRSCFILPAPNPGLSRCFAWPEIEEGTITTVCIFWGCLQELWCRRTTCGLEHMVRGEWAYCKCFKMVRKRKVFYKGKSRVNTLANPPRIRRLMLVLTEEGRGREQHTGRGLGGLWMEDRHPPTASGQEDVSWAKGEDILRSRTTSLSLAAVNKLPLRPALWSRMWFTASPLRSQ